MPTPTNMPASPDDKAPENLSSLYERTLVCAQRLISLNLKATQSLMEGHASGIEALMRSRDIPSACRTQSEIARKLVGQAVDYAVDFNEVVAANQKELTSLLKAQTKDLAQAFGGRGGAPDLPVAMGPKMMVDVVRSMLQAATHSRDYMMHMAQEFDGTLHRAPKDK